MLVGTGVRGLNPIANPWRRNRGSCSCRTLLKYHFNLVAANGQVIATSEAYERKQSALSGIEE